MAGSTISYQVVIPQIPPTKSTSMVEIVSGLCSLDPDLPNGTSWVLKLDGIIIDNYIGPNYGAGYVVTLQENGHSLALGSFTFDYVTGRITYITPRTSTDQLFLKAYRAKVINPDAAGGVQRIAGFGREADTGISRRYAREDHNHGSPTDPVPVHAGDPNVHHLTLHDHSLAVDGTTVAPQTLVAGKKFSGVVGAEVHVSSTSLKYMTNEVTPVQKTVATTDILSSVATSGHHADLTDISADQHHNHLTIGADGEHSLSTSTQVLSGVAASTTQIGHAKVGANTPTTQAFGDAAVVGAGDGAANSLHKHAMMAAPAPLSFGTLESRPTPGAAGSGAIYLANDVGVELLSDGSNWHPIGCIPSMSQIYWEDFQECDSAGIPRITSSVSGSGTVGLVNGYESTITLNTGSTTSSYVNVGQRAVTSVISMIAGNTKFLMMMRIRSSIGGASSLGFIGLGDSWPSGTTTALPTNGYLLERTSSDWNYIVRSGGSTTHSQAASATGTSYYIFYVIQTSSGIEFYRDSLTNTPAATFSGSLPTTSGGNFMMQVKNTSNAVNSNLDSDFFGFWSQR